MTTEELALCRFLHSTWQRSQELADKLDPERKRQASFVQSLDYITEHAARSFIRLTGHSIHEVDHLGIINFNSETPREPWASLKARAT